MSINIMTESYPVDLSVTEQPIKLTISNLMYQAIGVSSVNAKTGNVVLTAADVDADPVGAANDVLVELQPQIDSVSDTVTAQGLTLLTKADIATLTSLAQLVDTKADQSYVVSEIARITGNAPAALDTLAEIAEQLGNDQTQINNLLDQIGNRVRFDAAQALTAPEQTQARDNINAEAKGVAASLVSGVTTTSIGAATTAQGTKADTALQSGDVAPVALSGSFSDLVNKSNLFSLVYSAYAIGSNVVIAATDTLGQMLGKLQAQINSNVTAINTKEPNIVLGNTTQYWRGDKTWRELATDVRETILTGLSTSSAAAIVATDSVLIALGKLQAQAITNALAITANQSKLLPVPTKLAAWYTTGRWYDCAYPVFSVISSAQPTPGSVYFIPFQILENSSFDQIGVNVTVDRAGATMRIGIYNSDANNQPASLIFDSGVVDAATIGEKSLALNMSFTAGQMIYLGLYSGSVSPTLTFLSAGRNVSGALSLTAAAPTHYRTTGNSGLPSTVDGSVLSVGANSNAARVMLRKI